MKLNEPMIPRETKSFLSLLASLYLSFYTYASLTRRMSAEAGSRFDAQADPSILNSHRETFLSFRSHYRATIERLIGGNSVFVYLGDEFEELPIDFGDDPLELVKIALRVFEDAPGVDEDTSYYYTIEPSTTIEETGG